MKTEAALIYFGIIVIVSLYAMSHFKDGIPYYLRYVILFVVFTCCVSVFLPGIKKLIYFGSMILIFGIFMVFWKYDFIADPTMFMIGFFLIGIEIPLMSTFKNYKLTNK